MTLREIFILVLLIVVVLFATPEQLFWTGIICLIVVLGWPWLAKVLRANGVKGL